ncbi:HAD family hydrolase [Grimontia marina]|uniref:Haloacid dehalogenase-like hydrolase n=1 Tax=Grimontia marina TaxID=646534 RepID=A0A128FIP8_9GAMM|nr:HAD family hydrolase [Grimontia marina]CZF86156.1 haloacid dehalogenase-like hydrolase [Grimontia marina]
MASHLAVFDLDETLVEGDSMSRWHQYLIDLGMVSDPDFLQKDQEYMDAYCAGTLALDDYLKYSLSPLLLSSKADVDALAKRFVQERMLEYIFPEAMERFEELRAEGTTIIIISASLAFLVHPIAKEMGVEVSMGLDLLVEEGRYRPITEGIPSFREGKVHRLTQWIATLDNDFDHVSFYSDSINDLPMCLFADEVYVVNPCSQLFKKAGEYQWPVLKWGSQAR